MTSGTAQPLIAMSSSPSITSRCRSRAGLLIEHALREKTCVVAVDDQSVDAYGVLDDSFYGKGSFHRCTWLKRTSPRCWTGTHGVLGWPLQDDQTLHFHQSVKCAHEADCSVTSAYEPSGVIYNLDLISENSCTLGRLATARPNNSLQLTSALFAEMTPAAKL